MSSPTSFVPSASASSYANLASPRHLHTYSNSGPNVNEERAYANSSSASTGEYINGVPLAPSRAHNISRRPRMPPPQPPQVPSGASSAGVTINGIALNASHT